LDEMLCLRCSRGLGAISLLSNAARQAPSSATKASSKRYILSQSILKLAVPYHLIRPTTSRLTALRTFTSLLSRRPTIPPQSATFRPSTAFLTPSTYTTSTGEILDLLPKISSHPTLGSIQIRCGPRNTFSPSHFVRKRRHGFLSRIRTRKGRMTLARRRAKKRSTLSH